MDWKILNERGHWFWHTSTFPINHLYTISSLFHLLVWYREQTPLFLCFWENSSRATSQPTFSSCIVSCSLSSLEPQKFFSANITATPQQWAYWHRQCLWTWQLLFQTVYWGHKPLHVPPLCLHVAPFSPNLLWWELRGLRKSLNAEANKCNDNMLRNIVVSHKTETLTVGWVWTKHQQDRANHVQPG